MWRMDEVGEGGVVASLLSVEEQEVHDDDARVGCCHYHHWDEALSLLRVEGQTRWVMVRQG